MTKQHEPATDEEIAATKAELHLRADDFDVTEIGRLIARIDKEREQAEKAEAEREALIDQNRTYRNQGIAVAKRLEAAESEAAALRQEVERLRKLLEPFGYMAVSHDDGAVVLSAEDDDLRLTEVDIHGHEWATIGDLRRARFAALTKEPTP